MKKYLLSIGLLMLMGAKAQIKSGIINYEMVTSMGPINKDGDQQIPEAILAMMPKEIRNKKLLKFTETKSIFENVQDKENKKEEEMPQDNGGGPTFTIKRIGAGSNPNEKLFTDLAANKKMETKNFFGKDFLVTTDSINNTKWKLTGKQKLILNYPCYEAITMGEVQGKQDTIFAWYTPQISSKTGPLGFCNLPGMIMHLELGKRISVTATSIQEQAIADTEIAEPTVGKKVTSTEFKAISEKKLKEMGIENGKPKVMFNTMGN
jgi:GLPGLI family protein